MIYRQGDVLLLRVAAVPASAKREKPKARIILAEGEATGHHHSVAVVDDTVSLWTNGEEERFLKCLNEAVLEHQEHSPITIPPGTYRVVRQREYAPGAIRRVAD